MGVEQGQRCSKLNTRTTGAKSKQTPNWDVLLTGTLKHTLQNISPSLNVLLILLFSFLSQLSDGCSLVTVGPLHKCITNSNNQILESALEQLNLEAALDQSRTFVCCTRLLRGPISFISLAMSPLGWDVLYRHLSRHFLCSS